MAPTRNSRQTRPQELRISIAVDEGSPSLSIGSSDSSFVSLDSLRSHRTGVATEGIKLNLTSLKQLYGRKKEQEQLIQSFQRACEPDSSAEVVMINGVSGVGKTALVEDWKNSVVRKSSAYFLEAKYQQASSVSEPFSALKVAFRQLLEYLSKDEDLSTIRDLLTETLGSQVRPLTKLLPSLRKILIDEDEDDKEEEQSEKDNEISSRTSSGNTNYAMMQLGLVFVRVLRAIGRPSHPIVLFLDDIQWADEDSMDFISSLMVDQDCRNFMLIGAFRVENDGSRSAGSLSVQSLADRRSSQQSRNSRALSLQARSLSSSRNLIQAERSSSKRLLPNGKKKKVSTRSLLLARAFSFRKTENEGTSESDDRQASTRNLLREMSIRWSRVPINAKASSQAAVHETNIPPPPPDFSSKIRIFKKFTRGGTSRTEQSREPDADQTPPNPVSSQAGGMFRKPTRSTSSSETETYELDEEPGKLISIDSPPNGYRRNGLPVARSPVAIHGRKGLASLSDSNYSASRRWGKRSLEKNQSVPQSPSSSRSSPHSVSRRERRSNDSTSQRWRGPTKTGPLQPWQRRSIPSVSEAPGRSTTSTNESNHYFAAVGGRTTLTGASVRRSSVASDLSLIDENQVSDDGFGHDSLELNPHIADIKLSNLDLDSVNSVISVLIDRAPEECIKLATIVARKTHGNAYSILRFLEMLQRAGFLAYSTKTYRWEWDADRINAETTVTANVGELLAARIKTLPTQTQSLLMMAACIGQTFHHEILERVALEENLLGGTSDSETAAYGLWRESLNQILYESCKAELIEEDQDEQGVYRFLHDQVQKCLHTMIPEEKLPPLHLRVGRTIWQHKSFGGNAKYLFATVNHLNLGAFHIEDDEERIQLIELNLQASKIARSAYSFPSAALFLEKGIVIMDYDEDWNHHYALLLEIHTAAAEVHYACGNLKKSFEFAEEVIEHSTCVEDEVRAYFIKVDVLGAQRKFTEALAEGFKVLDLLGCHIPRKRKKVYLFLDLLQIRRVVLGKSSEGIISMAPMTDIVKVYTLRLLDSMTLLLWMIGHDSLVSILMTRMTLITLNHGISVYSPFSFAAYGMLRSHLGDVRGAYRFGSLALKLAEKLRSKLSLTRTALIVYTFTNHLEKPLMDSLEPMLNAHRLGLQAGDVEYSSMCLST
jgi:predicted ATPase